MATARARSSGDQSRTGCPLPHSSWLALSQKSSQSMSPARSLMRPPSMRPLQTRCGRNTGHCTHLGVAFAAVFDFFFGLILTRRALAFALAFALLSAAGLRCRVTASLMKTEHVVTGTFSRTSNPSVTGAVLNVKSLYEHVRTAELSSLLYMLTASRKHCSICKQPCAIDPRCAVAFRQTCPVWQPSVYLKRFLALATPKPTASVLA